MDLLTDQLSLLRWEEHVDVVWVNGGGEVLVAVDHSGASSLKLPSIDVEKRRIRVRSDGGGLPGNPTTIGTWVWSEPMKGTSIVIALRIRRLESKAIGNGGPGGLTPKNAANNTRAEITGRSTGSQANKARDLTTVH